MKKVVRLTETDLANLVTKVLNEQPVLPLDTRLKLSRDKYVKFLESSLRLLKPNEANEYNKGIDQALVNILNETGKLLEMVRKSELENQKKQNSASSSVFPVNKK